MIEFTTGCDATAKHKEKTWPKCSSPFTSHFEINECSEMIRNLRFLGNLSLRFRLQYNIWGKQNLTAAPTAIIHINVFNCNKCVDSIFLIHLLQIIRRHHVICVSFGRSVGPLVFPNPSSRCPLPDSL